MKRYIVHAVAWDEHPEGDMVFYKDHLKAMKAKEEEISRLTDKVSALIRRGMAFAKFVKEASEKMERTASRGKNG